ncbi:MAG: hypothetical protein MUD12_02290 [Spirochaetes bacterium]|jgi:hypothetical protein|nr:hypothetical protein [Spirochaetota bacterium]
MSLNKTRRAGIGLSIALIVHFLTASFLFSQEMKQENKPDEQAEKTGGKIGLSVGFKTNYYWWAPDFAVKKAMDSNKLSIPFMISISHPDPNMKTKVETGFLYNPVINIKLNDNWSISGSFSYGEFRAGKFIALYQIFAPNPSMYFNNLIKSQISLKKYDADLLFNYRLGKIFKFFFGPKYNGISQTNKSLTLMQMMYVPGQSFIPLPSKGYLKSHNGGLGLGSGITIPMPFDFYFLSNISFIGMLGNNIGSKDATRNENKTMVVSVGGSGSASIARYISMLSTTIEAGFKCQYLSYVNVRVGNRRPYDFYYGVFFGAVYNL